MKKPRVVFDTNILLSKLLTPGGGAHKLVGLFLGRKLELYTSRGQVVELVEVALRVNQERGRKGKTTIAVDDLAALVSALEELANFVPTQRQNKLSPDPDDDFIIGIAIKGKAQFLVTENEEDINPRLIPPRLGITVLNKQQALDLWLPRKPRAQPKPKR